MADDIERLRAYENENGYVRARLTLTSTQDGGRHGWIASGYRSCWDVSRAGDQSLLTDAPLLIEEAGRLDPGRSAIVRLHPLFREYWTDVAPARAWCSACSKDPAVSARQPSLTLRQW
jgi:hypothetical protein